MLLSPARFAALLALFATLLPLAAVATTPPQRPARVLLVNSYHPGYKWSDDIGQGLWDGLSRSGRKVELSMEFLDSRRFPTGPHRRSLLTVMQTKYQNYRPDLIVAADNAAFDFITQHRAELFPGVPVVFCGYNNLRPEALEGLERITGVNEEVNIAATVDAALALHPATRTLVFVLSTGELSSARHVPLVEKDVAPRYRSRYRIETIKDASMAEIRRRLASVGRDALVFIAGQTRDAGLGRALTPEENGRLIASASPAPVYSFWDFYLGTGVVGGLVLNGRDQGLAAAEMGARILEGTPPEAIPPLMSSPTTAQFDYRAMRRHGIAESALPAGAVVLNRPASLWELYKWQIVASLCALLTQTALIVVLLRLMRQRRQALVELERERGRLEERVVERTGELAARGEQLAEAVAVRDAILDNAVVSIALLKGWRFVWLNPHMVDTFGYAAGELIGQTPERLCAAPGDWRRAADDAPAALRGGGQQGEFLLRRKDGSTLWCLISGRALDPAHPARGTIYIAVDIDARHHAEHALQALNAELERLATVDPLTDLANRRSLLTALQREGERAARYGTRFSVLMIDVDHFKTINDEDGHEAGDRALRGLAQTLGQTVRATDLAGRWGGEEFLVICPETGPGGALTLAETLRGRVEGADFGLPRRVTVSIGVASSHAGIALDALLRDADAALYRAKAAGRNRVATTRPSAEPAG
ncbi:ABC transporter substrate binding protein [Crenobacter luteus]|uniref:ABC transporter substrate binding protein n=1 Tax=Crenobacter luteus TaxID=1452487 RepID=UPI0014044D56|nr:ABC transporter substrate binding protein [Crenobacter luteus]